MLYDVPSVAVSGEATAASMEVKSALVGRVIVFAKMFTCALHMPVSTHTYNYTAPSADERRRRELDDDAQRGRQRRCRWPRAHRKVARRPCRAGSRATPP